jgi:hypothetical protein
MLDDLLSTIIAKVRFLLTWINNLSTPNASNLNYLVNVVCPTPSQQKGTIKGLGFKPSRVQVGTPTVPSLPMSLKNGGANQLIWSARCDETICRNPVPSFPGYQI